MVGIYCINNFVSDKNYVGSSVNLDRRRRDHFCRLKSGSHVNIYLQRAWDKYGSVNFSFYVLEECNKNNIEKREYYWIKKLKSDNPTFGYNLIAKCNKHVEMRSELKVRKSVSAEKLWKNNEFRLKTIESLKKSWEKRDPQRLLVIKNNGLKRRNLIPVFKYDLKGEVVEKYSCRREAYLKNGKDRNVYRSLAGTIKKCKGFIFKYSKNWDDPHTKGQKSRKS